MKNPRELSSNYGNFKKKLVLICFFQDNYNLVNKDIAYILYVTEDMISMYNQFILSTDSSVSKELRGRG